MVPFFPGPMVKLFFFASRDEELDVKLVKAPVLRSLWLDIQRWGCYLDAQRMNWGIKFAMVENIHVGQCSL